MRRRNARSSNSSRHRRPLALQRPWQRPPALSWLSIMTLGAMVLCLLLLIFARGPITRASSRFIQYLAPDPEPPPPPTTPLPRPTFPTPATAPAPSPAPAPAPSPEPPLRPALPPPDAPAPLPQEVEPPAP